MCQRAAWLTAFIIVTGLGRPVPGREPRLKDVLARLGSYVTRYEGQLATLVAEEQYEQWTQPGPGRPPTARRTLVSDFGFLRLPGRPEWLGLRDTFAVDGQALPEREGRLDRLLSDESQNRQDLARRIVEENARYNLGVVARTVNVPMLALDLLGSRHRWRFSFHKRGEEGLEGRAAWAITFSERERPTVVKTPQGRNRPARGVVWADPVDGAVLRTELDFEAGDADESPAANIVVFYRREEALGLLVPSEMHEVYRTKTGSDLSGEIHAVARYAKFRQFRASARIVPQE